jgi:hypothetical protein
MNFFFAHMYAEDAKIHETLEAALGGYLELAGLFAVFGVPITFLISAMLGLPLYVAAKKAGLVNLWTCAIAGICVALVPWGILGTFNWHLPSLTTGQGIYSFTIVGLAGAVAGATFYWLTPDRSQSALPAVR